MNLAEYFKGVSVKRLSAHEVDPRVSHGHEFQGVKALQQFLGLPAERQKIPSVYLWLTDDESPIRLDLFATWYDARANQAHRAPEPRLYYPGEAEPIVHQARDGDTMFVCLTANDKLMFLLCPSGSGIEQQLLWLFGLDAPAESFEPRLLLADTAPEIGLAARYVLELIEIEVPVDEAPWLDRLLAAFGASFPSTAAFSRFAREAAGQVDVENAPDQSLMRWLDLEERLFLTFERHLISQRLTDGFVSNRAVDVDGFIQFSLSVQNRRKSRAGYSLENHLGEIFRKHRLSFERGAATEGKKKPDFLFPGSAAYHDMNFPVGALTLLGSKSSCKDRWRQVLSEGERVPQKHLITLEPGISVAQTSEMQQSGLQLVLPSPLHETYHADQRGWLMDLGEFLRLVRERQASAHA